MPGGGAAGSYSGAGMCVISSSTSGLQVLSLDRRVERSPAGLGVRVDDRKLDLRLVGVEVEEQLVDLVDDLVDPGIGAVDLVDDEDHRQPGLERLAQHEPGLRERSLARVDEQQHAVDHRQAALDLAAEVGVAGRVDDVELDAAVADRGVLGEDRDPLLALEVHRVHDSVGHVLAGAERSRLPQQGVDERRLAVVDMGDDREVADVLAGCHRPLTIEARPRPGCSSPRMTRSRRAAPARASDRRADRRGDAVPGAQHESVAVRL